MVIKFIELTTLICISLVCDIKAYKIFNAVVFPFIIIGLITNFVFYGFEGILFSLKGLFLPIGFLFILFALRMLGAGDIKLLGAVGAIMGPEFAFYASCYSFVCGGVISIIIMMHRKNGKQRIKYLFCYLKECFLTFTIRPYIDLGMKNDGSVFRFSYAIFMGTLLAVFLSHWGG